VFRQEHDNRYFKKLPSKAECLDIVTMPPPGRSASSGSLPGRQLFFMWADFVATMKEKISVSWVARE